MCRRDFLSAEILQDISAKIVHIFHPWHPSNAEKIMCFCVSEFRFKMKKNVLNLASNSAKCQFVKCLFAYVRWHKSHKSTSFSSEASFHHFLHLCVNFRLRSEAENLTDCDFSKQHMFLKGCCEDFVCYHSKNSRMGTAGVEPSWKRWQWLRVMAGKRPHETGRNGFFFFFSGFWPFCTQKVNMT